jgi:hypothetical protein
VTQRGRRDGDTKIGVDDGYLGDLSYKTHREFYPAYCDLSIDPDEGTGTTRERFIHILSSADAHTQAAILRGVSKKYPYGSTVYRTKAKNAELSRLIAQCSEAAAVSPMDFKTASAIVQRAIADVATLLASGGPTSAIDRIHTAIHGYLKNACASEKITLPHDASITATFKLLRQHHARLRGSGEQHESITRVLNSFASVLDCLNFARNRRSMAHPNEALLDGSDALLFINAARTLLQYLDARLLK